MNAELSAAMELAGWLIILVGCGGFVIGLLFGLYVLLKPIEPQKNRKFTPDELALKRQLAKWN